MRLRAGRVLVLCALLLTTACTSPDKEKTWDVPEVLLQPADLSEVESVSIEDRAILTKINNCAVMDYEYNLTITPHDDLTAMYVLENEAEVRSSILGPKVGTVSVDPTLDELSTLIDSCITEVGRSGSFDRLALPDRAIGFRYDSEIANRAYITERAYSKIDDTRLVVVTVISPPDKEPDPTVSDLLDKAIERAGGAFPNGDGTGGSPAVTIPNLGTFDHYPILFTDDLDSLMQVAMSTGPGMQSIAEGTATYQQTLLNNLGAQLAADPDNPDLRTELRGVLERTAGLNGLAERSVGRVEIDGAKDRDAQRQAFIDLVADATGLVPLPGADLVGKAGSEAIGFAWGQAVDLGKDASGQAFASETAGAVENANTRAAEGSNRIKVSAYLALVQSGVIPIEEVPASFLERGRLISLGDIPSDSMASYAQTAMAGVGSYATNHDIDGAYMRSFLKHYQDES